MTSKTHEVVYFDGAGRAEAVRILLHIAGIEFTDTRFKFPDWPSIKPTTPLGSVPVLKIDGVQHVQSLALMRYAGRLAKWYPKEADIIDALVVDEVLDTLGELMSSVPRKATDAGGDEEKFKTLRQEYQNGKMTTFLKFIEATIERNSGNGVYIVGSTPTIADLALMMTVKSVKDGNWDHVSPDVFESFPLINKNVDAMNENEGIKSYYASIKK